MFDLNTIIEMNRIAASEAMLKLLGTAETKSWGVFVGRFQPYHLGHASVVEEIVADGLRPLVVIGSADKANEPKNPLDIDARLDIIEAAIADPLIAIEECDDSESWDQWFSNLRDSVIYHTGSLDNCVFYINEKPEDKIPEFTFRGKVYTDAYYTDIYKDLGIATKKATYAKNLGINVNASDIRADLEKYKHFVHGSTYRYIKEHNLDVRIYHQ